MCTCLVSYSFIIFTALTILAFYAANITIISTTMGWEIEFGVGIFYLIFLLLHTVSAIPGIESRNSFYRLLRTIIFPGNIITFPEVLLADACTSLSKVFKDLGISILAIYVYFRNQQIIDYHDSSMILVALLASWPFW